MNFTELVGLLKEIPCDEMRKDSEGYYEFVISCQNLDRLYPILESYFGAPFKKPGASPSQKAKDVSKRYGGIQKQQTLYYVERDGLLHCAMIWPWGDGTRATVKMAQE